MTKNNLAIHLRWLLQQGPSLYPSIDPPSQCPVPADGEGGKIVAGPNDQIAVDLSEGEATATAVDDCQTVAVPLIQELPGDDEESNSTKDMARLAFAPQSASSSKRRMLSQPGSVPVKAPVTPRSRAVAESPLRHRAIRGILHHLHSLRAPENLTAHRF